MRSEREWWGRFEDIEERQHERVVLQHQEKTTFKADEYDFVEVVSSEGTPRIVVINATRIMQLEAHWLVLQPELVRNNPAKGWEAVGDRFDDSHFIGSEELSAIQLEGTEASTVCMIASRGKETFEIENFSEKPLELVGYRPLDWMESAQPQG